MSISSSVCLVVPPPPNPTYMAGWAPYAEAIRDVAYTVQTGLIDLTARWDSYAEASSFYADDVHPNDAGAADIATAVTTELLGRGGEEA